MLALAILSLRYGHKVANRILAAFLIAESLRLFALSYNYLPAEEGFRWIYLWQHLSYCFGPLLYLYVRLLVQEDYRLRWSVLWHFSPVFLAIWAFLPGGILLDDSIGSYTSFDQLPADQRIAATIGTLPAFLSLLIYSLLAMKYLQHHSHAIREQFSDLALINLDWLRALVWFCIVTAVVSGTIELLRALTGFDLGPRVVMSVLLSVTMIFYIGLMGLRQPAIFDQGQRQLQREVEERPVEGAVVETVEEETRAPTEKYQKSGLDQARVETIWQRLGAIIETDKPYLQAGIKLAELAEQVGTLPNYLSQTINLKAGQNFFEYISQFRLEEARRQLRECPDKTIAEIALDSGFNSQNVFNGQFKKNMATTPSQYRKEQRITGSGQ